MNALVRAAGVIVLLGAALGACREAEKDPTTSATTAVSNPPAVNNDPPPKGLASYKFPSAVELEVDGAAHKATFKGEGESAVLRYFDADFGLKTLTVGVNAPVTDAESGLTIQEAFVNLVDFDKNGAYSVAGGEGPKGEQSNRSHVIVFRKGADGKPTDAGRYDIPAQACSVTIAQFGDEGSLSCPELKDNQGRSVRLMMKWRAIGPHTEITPQTGPPPSA